MQQLSGTDNIFLLSERDNVYNHVAALMIYDVTTAPGGKVRFRDILSHFEEKIELLPVLRRHLHEAPFGIDRPYWIEAGEIDVEFHVRHIALPAPGDWRQLMIQVARLHSRPLDRSRPVWEAYIIEGLDNIPKLPKGSFAMFLKMHHSSVDGVAGVRLAEQLHATTPELAPTWPGRRTIMVDRPPSAIELYSRSITNSLTRVSKFGGIMKRMASLTMRLGAEAVGIGDSGDAAGLSMPKPPRTRFDAEVSANRVVEGFGMPLSRIKRVRAKLPGVTLNDIFLTVTGGGVRKYLSGKHDLPERSLVAMMPIALKSSSSDEGNAVGAAMVPLCSDIETPLERLAAVSEESHKSKLTAEKLGTDLIGVVLDVVPSVAGNLLLDKVLIGSFNLTASNVRGPGHPLYLAGAKAMCMYPVSIPTSGAGLNITGVSYNGVMWVSTVSCRKLLPDPENFLACMKEAWEELLEAADALPDPKAKRRRTAKKVIRKRAKKKTGKPATK